MHVGQHFYTRYISIYIYAYENGFLKNHFKSIKFMSAIVDFYALRSAVVSAIFHIDFGLNNKLTILCYFSFQAAALKAKLWIDSTR